MPIIKVASEKELDEYINKGGKVFIDYNATWCAPCKVVEPKIEQLSGQYENITYLSVDIDTLKNHSIVKTILSVPHFEIYNKGQKIREVNGDNLTNLEKLSKMLQMNK